jgi:hypothetical protein
MTYFLDGGIHYVTLLSSYDTQLCTINVCYSFVLQGEYLNGAMEGQGFRVLQNGSCFAGTWKDDLLQGDAVYMGTMDAIRKTVHSFDKGVIVSEREFNRSIDWDSIEAPGRRQ